MEPRSGVKVAVGVFVCLGLLLFAGSIFLLGQRGRYFAVQHPLRTGFTSVVGLHEGATVQLAGVAVGRVTGIRLLSPPGQKVLVEFNVAGDAIENVRRDSRARLETMGFMGDKFVEVSVGSPAEPQVGDGATLAAEDPIDVAALVGQGRRLLGNAEGLTAALARGDGALPWLINDPESKRLLAETLGSVRAVTASLEHGEGAAAWLLRDPASRQLLQHAARTVEAFETLAADVRRGPGLAHALIYDPEGSRLLPKVAQTLQETHALLDAIRHSDGARLETPGGARAEAVPEPRGDQREARARGGDTRRIARRPHDLRRPRGAPGRGGAKSARPLGDPPHDRLGAAGPEGKREGSREVN